MPGSMGCPGVWGKSLLVEVTNSNLQSLRTDLFLIAYDE